MKPIFQAGESSRSWKFPAFSSSRFETLEHSGVADRLPRLDGPAAANRHLLARTSAADDRRGGRARILRSEFNRFRQLITAAEDFDDSTAVGQYSGGPQLADLLLQVGGLDKAVGRVKARSVRILDKERLSDVGPVPLGGGHYAHDLAEDRIKKAMARTLITLPAQLSVAR